MANSKDKEVKTEVVDKQKFIQRKLKTLNQKDGAKHERNAVRVIQNNQ